MLNSPLVTNSSNANVYARLQLAMATLGITGLVAAVSMGGNKASKAQGPPIQASSGDEEKFIRYVVSMRLRAIG